MQIKIMCQLANMPMGEEFETLMRHESWEVDSKKMFDRVLNKNSLEGL